MATVNFYLKDPTKEVSLIFLVIKSKGTTIKISIGENVPPLYWDSEKKRVKKTSKFPQNPELNNLLNCLQSETERYILNSKSAGIIQAETLKEHIKKYLNKGQLKETSFFSVYQEFIDTCSIHKDNRTIQKYKTLENHLKEFQRKKSVKITWNNIDIKFYDKLVSFYLNDLEALNNTFGKYVSTLKTFLNWSTERGYNQKLDYKKFKAPKEDADIIYLTNEELKKIEKLNLKKNPKLDRVRDIFILGCYTGLRFSDLNNLKNENITKDHILLKSFKTRETLFIPLRKEAKKIIQKYKDEPRFLPIISNQKMNEYIKNVGEEAKINSNITITKYRGSEHVEFKRPKYKFLSTHTARRTFVTLSLENGARPEVVMAITGHKSYKTFKKYIKITSKVIETEMKRVWNNATISNKTILKVS